MRSRLEVIATFNEMEKAEAAQAKLAHAGIEARIFDESKSQLISAQSKPLACEKVLVWEEDMAKARHFLQSSDARDYLLVDEVRCAHCGSPRVRYAPLVSQSNSASALGLADAIAHLFDRTLYCSDCHYKWSFKESIGALPVGRPEVGRMSASHSTP